MDPEAKAFAVIMEALGGLEDVAQKRVVRWVGDRVGVGTGAREERGSSPAGVPSITASSDGDLAEFFAAAGPETDPERVLVAATWFQRRSENEDLDSQSINTALKQLGHGVSNVTRSLDLLMSRRPRLVIQTKKAGIAKQARKRYRVTSEGIRAVDRMISRIERQEVE